MPQNEMVANVDDETVNEEDVLCVRVNTISYGNMIMYMLLFSGFSFVTFGKSTQVYSTDFFIGLGFMLWMLVMSIATSVMHIGVAVQRADYVFPCLIMTVVTCFAFMAYMFYIRNPIQTIIISLSLIYILMTWYPIFDLYKKLLMNSVATFDSFTSVENQPLNATTDARSCHTVHMGNMQEEDLPKTKHLSLYNQPPPSYECVMGLDR